MYRRKSKPKATCLYSPGSMDPRILSAAAKSVFSIVICRPYLARIASLLIYLVQLSLGNGAESILASRVEGSKMLKQSFFEFPARFGFWAQSKIPMCFLSGASARNINRRRSWRHNRSQKMKLEKLSLNDDQFVTAEIITDTGTISVEAEVLPISPIHVENAIWKENGADAADYISQHLDTVRAMIKEALPQNA